MFEVKSEWFEWNKCNKLENYITRKIFLLNYISTAN